jgi:hypothetical protein
MHDNNNQFRDDKFLQDEWTAFVHEVTTEDLTPQPAVADFDDRVWKNFTAECERESAAHDLGIEIDSSAPAPRPRLRSERPDEEVSEDFSKSTGANVRKRAVIADWLRRRVAAGDDVQDIITASSSSSTRAIMQSILDGGEL